MTTDPKTSVPEILTARFEQVRTRMAGAQQRAGRTDTVTLIAVSKTVTPEIAAVAFDLGIRDFGESRPQELWKKQTALPEAHWHLIGHLQRNKIDKTIPRVSLVHSVDSDRLLHALDEFGRQQGRAVPICLEVNCSREPNKGGIAVEELPRLADQLPGMSGLDIQGLMTMAAYHDDPRLCRPAFAELRTLREDLRTRTGLPLPHLSMGMSNDFEIAIEEGATLVRVGTTLFEGLADAAS